MKITVKDGIALREDQMNYLRVILGRKNEIDRFPLGTISIIQLKDDMVALCALTKEGYEIIEFKRYSDWLSTSWLTRGGVVNVPNAKGFSSSGWSDNWQRAGK